MINLLRRWIQNHQRALAAASVAVSIALLSARCLSPESALGAWLTRSSYNMLFTLSAGWQDPIEDSPVMIVYLDPESYAQQQQDLSKPWSRSLHASLVNRLTQSGAKLVIFDIVFSDPGPDAAADLQFADAIRANGRVVLAGELNRNSRATSQAEGIKTMQPTLPDPQLLHAAATWGLANLIVDNDFVVRKHFPGFSPDQQPSLTWAAARLLKLRVADVATPARTHWLRYYGRPLSALPHVSYSQALETNSASDSFFRDKIVFIGARPMTTGFKERRDEFRSPYHSWDKDLFSPAVEVHATQMLNLLRGDWLRRWPMAFEKGLLFLSAFVLGFGLFRFAPAKAAGFAFLGEVLILCLALTAFAQGGIWFPWLIPSVVQIPFALGGSALYHTLDWIRQRRRFEVLRRQAEQRIKEQAALIDKAQDAILVRDLDGRISYANPSAERLYGWTNAELQEDGAARQLFAPCERELALAAQAVRDRGEWVGELEQGTRSAERRTVESRWTLIRDEQGLPKSVLLINTDITEKKRLEAQFLRVQRMETIGSLAGSMAHDLNSALSPILMGIQLIRRKPHDDETRQMLSVMEANTRRGADMVRQVLTFARGRKGERELVNVGRLVREIEDVIRQTLPQGIKAAAMAPADLWPVLANPTELHQVLLNLCLNARDAMPEGGELTLAADNVDLGVEEAKGIPNGSAGQYVMLLVSATGKGIGPEALPRIFEPFFTTKEPGQGTGLGLSTVARIVRSHGGFLSVKSEAGAGATFEVYIPRAIAAANPVVRESAVQLPRGNGELLLVVEEESSVREMIVSSLAEQGYQVLFAASEPEAKALLLQHRPDIRLVVTGVRFVGPGDRTGGDALPAEWGNVPVIFMSHQPYEAPGVPASGLITVLAKPFAPEQLLAAIAEALRRF